MTASRPVPPALRLRSVNKSYGPTRALSSVDLDVHAGEIVALMGANGAGKSTLIKILCGIQRADSGAIEIEGRSVDIASPAQAQERGIVAVHQSIADVGVPTLSVAENLLLDLFCTGAGPLVATPANVRRRAQERAERIGLDIDLDAQLADVSLADQQLIAIARAVSHRPTVMLFDEPTASLSAGETEKLFRVIEGLRASGVAIIYVSHKIADIRRLADRVVVLRDGRISASFERPVEINAAIRAMIGHDLPAARPRATSDGPPIFRIRNARLRKREASFDLDVGAGEIIAVTGPLGSGKSALAGAIFGLWPLAEGQMWLEDQPWRPSGPAQSIASGVFYAGEDRWRTSFFPSTVPFASVAGTISFPFLRRWRAFGLLPIRQEGRVADDAIATFGIKARSRDVPLTALSGGNQQKVVLARWQAEPARLLLLDEPFQGVDVGARDDIIRAIRTSSAGRATIVFVSDYEEALEVGDRILTIENGVIQADTAAETAIRASSPAAEPQLETV
ncbi:ABC transporter ATP-binding protein [Shinella sumterensis]|uniref:sugar ABC transporter ATP-binding protein n=1 Tax=Shinella sumterensis TaxID=1967501 RepID=UPI00106EA8AA|nr:sugar ABC transporter ATP-binding protein [Shinella sumterensis]MCD1262828.1 ATP-binding cassette domain-containing protein [Shinella sumterensis]TFE94779.1 ABC transporter ATP-binding protein [Shinella sumterensis]